jgi:hypothetical protein
VVRTSEGKSHIILSENTSGVTICERKHVRECVRFYH